MSAWAAERGIPEVALGHTADDVAETFLMRLARGSGLDGLASMSDRVMSDDGRTSFVRPLLHCSRVQLREELAGRGQAWADDPSNENAQYERVKMRKALAVLESLGITTARVADTAARLREAREELRHYLVNAAQQAVRFDAGDVLIPLDHPDPEAEGPWITDRDETFRRVLKAGLMWISGSEYPPRRENLEQLIDASRSLTATTVAGCHAVFQKGCMRITREWKAVSDLRVPAGDIWDGRWRLTGPEMQGAEIAALGEAGLRYCPDRKAMGRPAVSLVASPAVWRGSELLAAPLAGLENGWSAELIRDEGVYYSKL
jgi:tRNA(Ile)-lysidine synthase